MNLLKKHTSIIFSSMFVASSCIVSPANALSKICKTPQYVYSVKNNKAKLLKVFSDEKFDLTEPIDSKTSKPIPVYKVGEKFGWYRFKKDRSLADKGALYTLMLLSSASEKAFKVGEYLSQRVSKSANIESINLPNVEEVERFAFPGCKKLKSVYLPECRTIGSWAFASCKKLKTLSLPKCERVGEWAFHMNSTKGGLTTVNLPECKEIANHAFGGCAELKSISIPNVKFIGESAFYSDTSLESISLPCCEVLNRDVFDNCYRLKDVHIPNVRKVGYGCFSENEALTSINLPKCTSIEGQGFANCYELKNVYAPLVTHIDDYSFANTPSLKKIELPECTDVAEGAFSKFLPDDWADRYTKNMDFALEEVSLPKCKHIGKNAFDGRLKLKKLTVAKGCEIDKENKTLNQLVDSGQLEITYVD